MRVPGYWRSWILVAAATWPACAAAQLTVRTDAMSIHETDTFEVQVQAEGVDLATPDFTPLERDFEILGSRTASQYNSINGRVEAWSRWTLTLKPKRTGSLVIPALELDGHRSKPLPIEVKPLDEKTREAIDALVFFEVEVSPQPVYVQAELSLIRRLYYADGTQLYGDLPAAPDIPEAVVQDVGEPKSSTTRRDGRRYGVIEQRYAIFPERSGRLTIPAVAVSGSVRLPTLGTMRQRTGVRIRSEEITVDVLAIPDSYPPDVSWLPARRVELIEAWDAGTTLTLGTPVQRSLMVRAEGTVASMIPPLDVALPDGIRGYPDPPELRDASQSGRLVGTRVETMSLVPGAPGPETLPAVSLTWFDTATGTVRHARIDARRVDVAGAAPRRMPAPETPASGGPRETEKPASAPSAPPEPQAAPRGAVWDSATLALAILSLIALAGWGATAWRLRAARRTVAHEARPAPNREPAAFRAWESACAGSVDPHALRTALLAWAGALFDCPIEQAASNLRSADAAWPPLLDGQNGILYGTNCGTTLDADTVTAFRAAALELRRRRTGGSRGPETGGLGPLYPSSS